MRESEGGALPWRGDLRWESFSIWSLLVWSHKSVLLRILVLQGQELAPVPSVAKCNCWPSPLSKGILEKEVSVAGSRFLSKSFVTPENSCLSSSRRLACNKCILFFLKWLIRATVLLMSEPLSCNNRDFYNMSHVFSYIHALDCSLQPVDCQKLDCLHDLA